MITREENADGSMSSEIPARMQAGEGGTRVLAINSSPRERGTSKTLLLDALVTGMREAGAEVEVVHLREKRVRQCLGCYACWTETPGKCAHEDDMTNELLPKWLASDLVVYDTPLYHFTVNAALKAFIERTLPTVEPFLVQGKGRTVHPRRHPQPDAVVLSVVGFPDASVFDQLSSYVRFLFGDKLRAEIYRPASEVLSSAEYAQAAEAVVEATAEAGRELIRTSRAAEETRHRIAALAIDGDVLMARANRFWRSCLEAGVTPMEYCRRNPPRSQDCVENGKTS